MSRILKVDSVELSLKKSNPPQLVVIAIGTASSLGWENPVLKLPKKDPEEGIYELDFFADPPEGNVGQQEVSGIKVSYTFKEIPKDMVGIKVVANTNSIEKKVNT